MNVKDFKRKPNILFVDIGFASNWGGSRSLVNMVNSVKDRINPTFVFLTKCIEDKSNLLKDYKVIILPCKNIKHSFSIRPLKKVFSYPFKVIESFIYNLRTIPKVVKIIKENQIDIVHSNTSVFSTAFIAAKICGVKHVWHLREFQKEQNLQPCIGFSLFKKLLKKSNACIAITRAIKDFYEDSSSSVIYDAVFAQDKICIPFVEKEDFVLFLGAVSKGKGIIDAINAFSSVASQYPNLKLKIVGSGDYEKEAKLLIEGLACKEQIEMLGRVADSTIYFQKAKVFLMPSYLEALGRVTIEAMLHGCPVVGRNTGGTKELLANDRGYLFNTQEEFVGQLCQALNNPNQSMITKAKTWAEENFSESVFATKLMEVYQNLLAPKGNENQ